MYTFIVLGIIPGTTIQINFDLWLYVVLELTACILLYAVMIKTYRYLAANAPAIIIAASLRVSLHSTQLHLRAQ